MGLTWLPRGAGRPCVETGASARLRGRRASPARAGERRWRASAGGGPAPVAGQRRWRASAGGGPALGDYGEDAAAEPLIKQHEHLRSTYVRACACMRVRVCVRVRACACARVCACARAGSSRTQSVVPHGLFQLHRIQTTVIGSGTNKHTSKHTRKQQPRHNEKVPTPPIPKPNGP
jgi:hypothetical protein